VNFTNFLKLVWLDLDSICKIYKRNKKTEKKEKEENKIKIEKGPGQRFGPEQKQARGPLNHFPNKYPLFLSPSLTCGPHMSSSSSSRKTRRRPSPLPPLLLLYSSLFPTYFGSPLRLFNPRNPLCISPLLPPSETPPGRRISSPESAIAAGKDLKIR
jgi:hypothetical protein